MADPFSIVAGTASLADACIRLTKFLKKANDEFQAVDQVLGELFKEIASLRSVNDLLRKSYAEGFTVKINFDSQRILDTEWHATQDTLISCQHIIEQIEALLKRVVAVGGGRHIRIDQFRKWLKLNAREEALGALHEKLKRHQVALQLSLSAVSMIYSRTVQQSSHKSYGDLSRSLQNLSIDLKSDIASLKKTFHFSAETTLDSTLPPVQKGLPFSNLNRHFFTPQTVSSIYTGRENDLEVLRKALVMADPLAAQKRFVVFGLAGSGKTQFCCKFASDNKQRFWGVFWINASSKEHAEQSFATFSMIGKVAPNQAAVKSWLSSLGSDQPWLLIIDNADEKDVLVEDYFPDSHFGTILVTTRNPMLKTRGTVRPRYYEFQGLDEKCSVELLLNAADESKPWISSSINLACTIAKTLGYLPLALVHAGKAILARLCTLETYLDYFSKNFARIRLVRESNATPSALVDTNATIYSSFELIHQGLLAKKTQASDDAIDLLNIFSLLDRQRIQLKIFVRAGRNPRIESDDEMPTEKEREMHKKSRSELSWSHMLKDIVTGVVGRLSQSQYRPVLPEFLAAMSGQETFDDLRLRKALKELFEMSLITASSGLEDCYSMHAAVHLWVRQRPEMTLMEQAVWCQMTATILSRAILLPPLGDTEEDEIFRRDLLPHVRHVRQVEQSIQAIYAMNRSFSQKVLPTLRPLVTADRLVQLVKFSLVYAQGHQLEEAEKLQTYVADFAVQYLGLDHIKTIKIMRLLSWTYWQLARVEKAVELQKRALEACIKVLGREHPETLQIMNAYGTSLWLQGRIPEARKTHLKAVEGLIKSLGSDHILTLKAMGGLGRAVGKNFEFTEAINIQLQAFTGLKIKLGPSHSATLEAMDNLAMAYFDRAAYLQSQTGDLENAHRIESEVYAIRAEKFGKEHYHTLWSGLNLARIKAIRGHTDEALSIFLSGHAVVRRDLGENHFIYLFGELHHGRILMCAKKYEEAEMILSNVVDSHKKTRSRHPDRLLAMFSLIKCRNILGKNDQTADLLMELTEKTKALFGPNHAAVKYLLDESILTEDTSDVKS